MPVSHPLQPQEIAEVHRLQLSTCHPRWQAGEMLLMRGPMPKREASALAVAALPTLQARPRRRLEKLSSMARAVWRRLLRWGTHGKCQGVQNWSMPSETAYEGMT